MRNIEIEVARAHDDTHTAGAEGIQHLQRTQPIARMKCHTVV